MSVVSRATGSDQLWASRAVRELCLYLFPATDSSVCLNHAVHHLLCLPEVLPAVAKKCARIPLLLGLLFDLIFSSYVQYHLLKMYLLCYAGERYNTPTVTNLLFYIYYCQKIIMIINKILIQCLSPRLPFISTLLAQSSVSLKTHLCLVVLCFLPPCLSSATTLCPVIFHC